MNSLLMNYGRLIRNRRYFPLWLGQLISNLGDTLHYIALVVWVYQRTGSGFAVAGAVLFEVVPIIVMAPVAGVVIDRLPRQAVLVISDLVRAMLVLALLLTTELWQIYTIIALLTAAGAFFSPAVNATLPTLLAAEDLLAANSISWSTGRLVQILGAALAAGVIAAVGAEAAFSFNAATFLVSALLLLLLPVPPGRDVPAQGWQGFMLDALAGFEFARQDRFVSRLVMVQTLASFSVGATSALLVILAQDHYRLPPVGLASLFWPLGLGRYWARSCWRC
jgi:MFS family permease